MAFLPFQTATTMLQTGAAAVQGAATTLIDITVGSLVRALLEAYSAIALWLQYLILIVLTVTRAATSNGADLDSWVADFGLVRLAATQAAGTVTFSRYTPTLSALILVGTNVRTSDGTQTFVVTTDTTNSLWNTGLGGYLIPAATASGNVPVQAATAGTGGNVLAGTITQISSAIAGVDLVTNAASFTNGLGAETDPALRARFVAFITSQARATVASCIAAASAVQSGLLVALFENVNSAGALNLNTFTMVIDDGSGAPNSTLLNNVYAAVNGYRPIGVQFAVVGPNVTGATVVIVSTPPSGVSASTYTAAVSAAVTAYINGLGIGATLVFSQIAIVAASAAPVGTTFPTITLNGSSSASLPPTGPFSAYTGGNMGVVRATSVTVT